MRKRKETSKKKINEYITIRPGTYMDKNQTNTSEQ